MKQLIGFGSGSGYTEGGTDSYFITYAANSANATANTFSNADIYIPNYTGSAVKSVLAEGVTENNASNGAWQMITAGVSTVTAPITSLVINKEFGSVFTAGSSATLYGINRTSAIGKPKAIGGNITYSNGYWHHVFTGSGSFSALEDIQVEYAVVAGGGGGGSCYYGAGAGAGAGGYRSSIPGEVTGGGAALEAPIAIAKGTSTNVLVGAGGVTSEYRNAGVNGGASSFGNVLSHGGGGGGTSHNYAVGGIGGSSGGSGYSISSVASAFAGEGYSGGAHLGNSCGAGGGGASQAGMTTNTGLGGGYGGAGVFSFTAKLLNLGASGYLAGGGGGGRYGTEGPGAGAGGIGGGGGGGSGQTSVTGGSGIANTGGGGGGGGVSAGANYGYGGSGGSGIVIARYRAD
jgi:hypothetical protein